jgi:PAS domain S-box-containing protein
MCAGGEETTIGPMASDGTAVDWGRAIRLSPVPLLLVELATLEVLEANAASLELFVQVGRELEVGVRIKLDERYRDLLDLIASGRLDGFDARLPSWSLPPNVSEIRAWVRRIDQPPDEAASAVIVLVVGGSHDSAVHLPDRHPAQLAVGTTDAEWRVQWVTQDVASVLGYQREELVGTPLLGIVHPDSAADLALALTHAHDGNGCAIVSVRLRRKNGMWSAHEMIVAPRPHDAAGILFILYPPDVAVPARPLALHDHLLRMADDVQVAALASDGDVGATTDVLSSRQWEIVTRLHRGERVPQIAAAMYLSQSTVRNHLTSVFRKFGVHSQSDLLTLLRKASRHVQSA